MLKTEIANLIRIDWHKGFTLAEIEHRYNINIDLDEYETTAAIYDAIDDETLTFYCLPPNGG
jgi:hypothetical protein